MNLDTSIFFWFNDFAGHSDTTNLIIVFFAEYLAYILCALLLLYVIFHHHPLKEKIITGVSALLAGLIARFGFGSTIRFFWHRPRPFLSYDVHKLIPESSYSFPSGHSTFFFAFSTVVYFHNKRLGIFFYVATICMTLARIMAGVHYPSDILAGMIIGTFCGWFVSKKVTPILKRYFNI